MMPGLQYTHSAEKAHDTTLDDENASEHDVLFGDGALLPVRSLLSGPQ